MNEDSKGTDTLGGIDTLGKIVEACVNDMPPGEEKEPNLRNCIIEQVAQSPQICKLKVYLVGDDGCPACENGKIELQPFLSRGLIETISSGDPKAKKMLDEVRSNVVPALILADCEGNALAQLEIYPS